VLLTCLGFSIFIQLGSALNKINPLCEIFINKAVKRALRVNFAIFTRDLLNHAEKKSFFKRVACSFRAYVWEIDPSGIF
jgi:hypothetical protein